MVWCRLCIRRRYTVTHNIVKFLFEHGANENLGQSLYVAAREGYYNIVKFLIEHGADEYLHDALSVADRNGHQDVVKFLTDYDASKK